MSGPWDYGEREAEVARLRARVGVLERALDSLPDSMLCVNMTPAGPRAIYLFQCITKARAALVQPEGET